MFGLHFRYAKAFQNSPCNDSRKFTNLMRLMDAGWYRKQKAIGEDLWVTVWWYRGTLLQDSGSPILSQFSTPSEGGPRSRGREEVGDVVDDSCLGRQYLLDRSFGPVTIFLSHFVYHVWPKNLGHKTAVGWFDYISIIFTVIFGEVFNSVGYLFTGLFLYLLL